MLSHINVVVIQTKFNHKYWTGVNHAPLDFMFVAGAGWLIDYLAIGYWGIWLSFAIRTKDPHIRLHSLALVTWIIRWPRLHLGYTKIRHTEILWDLFTMSEYMIWETWLKSILQVHLILLLYVLFIIMSSKYGMRKIEENYPQPIKALNGMAYSCEISPEAKTMGDPRVAIIGSPSP